jgi:uncharacterized protein HemY
MYAGKLIEEGELSAAESVVRRAIKKNWSSELARLYGQTRIENLRKQIALATTWLAEHEQDAYVNLTLARLNYAYGQIDKARVYYNMAIELGAGDEAYFELGQFYEDEGNHKTALSYYKRGVEASIKEGQPSVEATPEVNSLESIVTPGSADITLVVDEGGQPELHEAAAIEDAQLIEHKA